MNWDAFSEAYRTYEESWSGADRTGVGRLTNSVEEASGNSFWGNLNEGLDAIGCVVIDPPTTPGVDTEPLWRPWGPAYPDNDDSGDSPTWVVDEPWEPWAVEPVFTPTIPGGCWGGATGNGVWDWDHVFDPPEPGTWIDDPLITEIWDRDDWGIEEPYIAEPWYDDPWGGEPWWGHIIDDPWPNILPVEPIDIEPIDWGNLEVVGPQDPYGEEAAQEIADLIPGADPELVAQVLEMVEARTAPSPTLQEILQEEAPEFLPDAQPTDLREVDPFEVEVEEGDGGEGFVDLGDDLFNIAAVEPGTDPALEFDSEVVPDAFAAAELAVEVPTDPVLDAPLDADPLAVPDIVAPEPVEEAPLADPVFDAEPVVEAAPVVEEAAPAPAPMDVDQQMAAIDDSMGGLADGT